MNKEELLKKILTAKSDEEKRQILEDNCSNLLLYRYRPYKGGGDYAHEVESVEKEKPWASNLQRLDDDNEGTIARVDIKDIQSIVNLLHMINPTDALEQIKTGYIGDILSGQPKELLEEVKKIITNPDSTYFTEIVQNLAAKQMDGSDEIKVLSRDYRKNYAVTCFTENKPENPLMWKQYARSREGEVTGVCLEYRMKDILDAGYIIDPVFYKDNVTIRDLCKQFDNQIQCIFLHKDTKGVDKFSKETVCWEDQQEWRIIQTLKKGEDKKDGLDGFSSGCYLDNAIAINGLYYLENSPGVEEILNVYKNKDRITMIRRTEDL